MNIRASRTVQSPHRVTGRKALPVHDARFAGYVLWIRSFTADTDFLAAGRAGTVGMVQLLRAISQELTKLGRRPSDDQFGRWLPALTVD